MRIKWTNSAIDDIESIRKYITEESGVYAEQFLDKLVGAIEVLKIFPQMGRYIEEAKSKYIKEIIIENYRIIYIINDNCDQVTIVTIFHCKRDLSGIEKYPWEIT